MNILIFLILGFLTSLLFPPYFILPLGFIQNSTDSSTYEGSLSFGDIDKDGLDEIVLIDENNNIIVKNANNTIINGFPVNGEFSGVPLIANILNIEDGYPEIICREEESIIIISYNGGRLRQFSSFDVEQPLALVPFWEDKMILVDGSRLILFDLDFKNSFWLNSNSRTSGFPLSTGDHFSPFQPLRKSTSAYNYPNANFYFLPTRVWELILGSILAYLEIFVIK